MEDEPGPIARAWRNQRAIHRLTMEAMGSLIDKRHSYISQVEAGTLIPGSDVVRQMADALNVSADALLGREAGVNERMVRLMKAAGDTEIEDVIGFIETLSVLPANEQRVFARLVRLSGIDHIKSAPKKLRTKRKDVEDRQVREG